MTTIDFEGRTAEIDSGASHFTGCHTVFLRIYGGFKREYSRSWEYGYSAEEKAKANAKSTELIERYNAKATGGE